MQGSEVPNVPALFHGSGAQSAAPKPLFPSTSHDSLTSSQLRKLDGPRRDNGEQSIMQQAAPAAKNSGDDLSQISALPLARANSGDQLSATRPFPPPYHGITVSTAPANQKPVNPTAAQMVLRVRELMSVTSDQLQSFSKFPVAPFQLPNPATFLLKNFNVDIGSRLPSSEPTTTPAAAATTASASPVPPVAPTVRSSTISPFTGLDSLRKELQGKPVSVASSSSQVPVLFPTAAKRSAPTSYRTPHHVTAAELAPSSDRVTRASSTLNKPSAKPIERRPPSPPKAPPRRAKRPQPEDDVTGSEDEEEQDGGEQQEGAKEEGANSSKPEGEEEESAECKEQEGQFEEIGGEEPVESAEHQAPADDYVNAYEQEELEAAPEDDMPESLVVSSDSGDDSDALGTLYDDQSDDEFVESRRRSRSRRSDRSERQQAKTASKLRNSIYRPLVAPSPRLRGLAQYSTRSEQRSKASKKPPPPKKVRAQSPSRVDHFTMAFGAVPQLELHAQPVSYLRTLLCSFLIQSHSRTNAV